MFYIYLTTKIFKIVVTDSILLLEVQHEENYFLLTFQYADDVNIIVKSMTITRIHFGLILSKQKTIWDNYTNFNL